MADISEVQQQIEQAKSIAEQKRQESAQIERDLQQREAQLRTQTALRKTYAGVKGLAQRRIVQQQIAGQRGEVQQYQREVIAPYEKQIAETEQKVKQQQEAERKQKIAQADYEYAIRVYAGQVPAGKEFASIPPEVKQQAQQYVSQIEGRSISSFQKEIQPSQLPSVTQPVNAPSRTIIPQKELNIFEKAGKVIGSVGAGVGNVLAGRDFYTPRTDVTGTETLYPGNVRMTLKETVPIPEGTTPVATTSGIVYVPLSPDYKPESAYAPSYAEQIKQEGLLPPTIRKVSGFTENILNVAGRVGNIPTPTGKGSLIGVLSKNKFKRYAPQTIGESAVGVTKGIKKVGEISSAGWKDIFTKAGIPTEEEVTIPEYNIPLYQRATIEGIGTNVLSVPSIFVIEKKETRKTGAGMFLGAIESAPEIVSWTIAPEVMAGIQTLSSAEQLKKLDVNTKELLEQQYKEYEKTKPEEGYRLLTKKEFFNEYEKETKEQLKQQAIISGGLAMATLGISTGVRAYKAVTKPIISYRTPKPVEFVREVSGVSPRGKISTYNIFQYQAPTEMKVTTPIREAFKMKPKFDWTPITKPKVIITRPAFGSLVIGEEPYIAETGKLAKVPYGLKTPSEIEQFFKTAKFTPSRKFFEITGKAELIQPEEILKLPIPERYTWMGKEKILILKEGEVLSQSALSSKQYFGKIGKTFETSYIASKTEPIIETGGEEGIKLFKTSMRFKPTTTPFYRASGKIRELKGTLLEVPLKEELTLFTFDLTGKEIVSPLSKGNIPSTTKNILKTIPSPITKILPALPKVSVTKIVPSVITAPKTGTIFPLIETQYPTYVGGTKVKETTYPLYTGKEISFELEFNRLKIGEIPSVKIQQKEIIKTNLKSPLKIDLGIKQQLSIKEITKVQQKDILKEILKQQPKQMQKQMQKQIQKQTTKTKFTPKPRVPIKPITFFGSGKGKKITAEEDMFGFEILIKKKGKFVKTEEEKTLQSAFRKLKGELLGGLEASGYVQEKKTGRKIPVSGFEDVLFRVGKRSPTLLVQRKGGREGSIFGRLTTQAERREIKRSQKPKKTKKVRVSNNLFGFPTNRLTKSKRIKWF